MKRWAVIAGCALVMAFGAYGQDLVGEWDMQMDYQGNMIDSKMIVTKADDGSLQGVWTGRRGESKLENLKIDGNKVTFTRNVEVQGQSFEIAFEGTIEGNSITGAFDSAMGKLDVTGTRAGGGDAGSGDLTPLVGDWNAHVSSALGDFDHVIRFKDDGSGVYDGGDATYDITEVKLAGNAVTFAMTIDVDGQELPLTFEGTLDGSALNGQFISDLGNGTVEAMKAGAAPAIVGEWDVTSESQLGTLQRTLVVKPDLSGAYVTEADEFAISNLAQNGNDVTFDVTIDLQGQELPLKFAGVIDGSVLNGEFTSEAGNATVTAKRKGGGGNGELAALVDEFLTVLKAQDVEKLMTYYAEDFASDQGGGKAEFTEFLLGAKEQGFLEDMDATTDDMEITIDGDKATIENIELEGAFGVLTIGLELAKRDGKWLVTYQSQY